MKPTITKLSGLFAALPLALALSGNLHAETVARYGISMADIPLTTGQPDRGAGAYQFTGHTLYDPLVAWEANVGNRPGKLVPGLATDWKADPKDSKKWVFHLRKGVKFHRHKLRIREGLAGGQDEATRPRSWINDASGRTLVGQPGHHRLDDGSRGVDRTGTTPGQR